MKIRKFAAIDIGSNAIRLLINNVIEEKGRTTRFKKNSLVRVPIRLGQDTFMSGSISEENIKRMIDAFKAFQLIMGIYEVEEFMACATSAMREADNREIIKKRVLEETNIDIHIIDGKREAEIIASTDLHQLIEKDKSYLYVDVGGGSTEFTVFKDGKITNSKSFRIGTVRLLSKTVKPEVWEEIKVWIKKQTKGLHKISLIGSGGNINKLYKISGRKIGEPLSYLWLNSQYQFLKAMSYEDRIRELGLNPDRADVIIPATKIYLSATKWSGAKEIHVPKIGLSDGIIKTLYYSNNS